MALHDISSIVVSSRIRLARNIEKLPFPARLDDSIGYGILTSIADVVLPLGKFKVYTIKNLSAGDAKIMQEKHLISKDLLTKDFSGVILSEDESVSIMVNEEDHIREQCILPGLNLEKAYITLNAIDDEISKKVNISFDQRLGYLTASVANLGTGMRASVMLFLPALTILGEMNSLISSFKNHGLTVRGVYGENTAADGFFYQISNAVSLGLSEKEIIALITNAANRIAELETNARAKLLKEKNEEITDKIFRAYGTLTNCFLIPCNEFMTLAGFVKLGIALNIIRFKDNSLIDKLFFLCMPASLAKINGEGFLTGSDEDVFRAKYLFKSLKGMRTK